MANPKDSTGKEIKADDVVNIIDRGDGTHAVRTKDGRVTNVSEDEVAKLQKSKTAAPGK